MKQANFKQTVHAPELERIMRISAESKDELDDLITLHQSDGWRVKARATSHDGTYLATLVKVSW